MTPKREEEKLLFKVLYILTNWHIEDEAVIFYL